jgi:hypothetical protein
MPSHATVDRRSFMGAAVAATMAGIAGCATGGIESEGASDDNPESWPTPKDGQREVMLLGTSHLDQTPENKQNTFALDAGDVLGEQRQSELNTLTDRLAEWEPDRIAVEHPATEQSIVDQAYTAYADDSDDLDTISGWERNRESEIVQVGFRLADKLGHDSVAAVDYVQDLTALMTKEEMQQMPESMFTDPESVDYPLISPREMIEEEQQRLDEGSLLDHYRRLNTLTGSSFAKLNDQLVYAAAFENSELGDYAMVKLITGWTQRNLRIASNLWNVLEASDQRVLVVYGASHVPQLKQMLTATPMMAPVSPLSYFGTS